MLTCSNQLVHYYRYPGLTCATEENILRKLQNALGNCVKEIKTELCYNLDVSCDFKEEETDVGGSVLLLFLTLSRLCAFC